MFGSAAGWMVPQHLLEPSCPDEACSVVAVAQVMGCVLVRVLAGSLALLGRDMKAGSCRDYGRYGTDTQLRKVSYVRLLCHRRWLFNDAHARK